MAHTLDLAEIRGCFRLVVRTTLFVVRACLMGVIIFVFWAFFLMKGMMFFIYLVYFIPGCSLDASCKLC